MELTFVDKVVVHNAIGGSVWVLECHTQRRLHDGHVKRHVGAIDGHQGRQRFLRKRKHPPHLDHVVCIGGKRSTYFNDIPNMHMKIIYVCSIRKLYVQQSVTGTMKANINFIERLCTVVNITTIHVCLKMCKHHLRTRYLD